MRGGAWKVETNFSPEHTPLSQRGVAVTRKRDILGYGSAAWESAVGHAGRRRGGGMAGARHGRKFDLGWVHVSKRERGLFYIKAIISHRRRDVRWPWLIMSSFYVK